MKRIHYIILLFALLHALTAVVCRVLGTHDELILTMLTMLMTALVCVECRMTTEYTAIAIVVGNILGYVSGVMFPFLIGLALKNDYAVASVATFLTTILIGEMTLWCSRFFLTRQEKTEAKEIIWLVAALVIVFLVRALMSFIFETNESVNTSHETIYFLESFAALIVILFIFLISYTVVAKSRSREAEDKADLAQYRYMTLKQQVNPHFLFNSLNILDCLVEDGDNKQASAYIRKLASIYRYMIRNEKETLANLGDELEFVSKYIDLLKMRFADGLEVSIDVDDSLFGRKIIPCSLQLLIENATKHNIASESHPLRILIRTDKESGTISVTNDIQPKLTKSESTGVGLNYICQQYADASRRPVVIEDNGKEYKVSIPLL